MPSYKVTDPTSGQSLVLTGDSPPTEQELEQVFSVARKPTSSAPVSAPQGGAVPVTGSTGGLAAVVKQALQHKPMEPASAMPLGVSDPMVNYQVPKTAAPAIGEAMERMSPIAGPVGAELVRRAGLDPGTLGLSAINQAIGLPEFFTSKLGMATMGVGSLGPLVKRGIALGFGAQMAYEASKGGKDLVQNWQKLTPQERSELLMGTAGAATFAVLLGKGATARFGEMMADAKGEKPGVPPVIKDQGVSDLEDLQKKGTLTEPEALVGEKLPKVTKADPAVASEISSLESQLKRTLSPSKWMELQEARMSAKLTDGQWLALLRERRPQTAPPTEPIQPVKPSLPPPSGEPDFAQDVTKEVEARKAIAERQAEMDAEVGRRVKTLDPVHQRVWDAEDTAVQQEVQAAGEAVTDQNMGRLLREAKQRLTQRQWEKDNPGKKKQKPVPIATKPLPNVPVAVPPAHDLPVHGTTPANQPEADKLRTPALKIGDQFVEAPSHAEARVAAAKQGLDFSEAVPGFLTESGQFVDRAAGAEMFEKATGKKTATPGELHSEDMKEAGLLADKVKADRSWAEQRSEFVHDLNNVGMQLVSRTKIKPSEAHPVKAELDSLFSQVMEEKISPAAAKQTLEGIRQKVSNIVPKGQEVAPEEQADLQKELEGEYDKGVLGTEPTPKDRPTFEYISQKLLRDPKAMGFASVDTQVDATQLRNRLRNKLGEQSHEWKSVVEPLVKDMSGKVTPKAMAEHIEANAPKAKTLSTGEKVLFAESAPTGSIDKLPTPKSFASLGKQLRPERKAEFDALKLTDGMDAYSTLEKVVQSGAKLDADAAAAASFLMEHFETPLRMTEVLAAEARMDTAGGFAWDSQGKMRPKLYLNLENGGSWDKTLPQTIVHEAAHSAAVWAIENPVTEAQKAAVGTLESLRKLTIKSLSQGEKEFFEKRYMPGLKGSRAEYLKAYQDWSKNGGPREAFTHFYGLSNVHEFVSTFFESRDFRDRLSEIPAGEGVSMRQRAWELIKNLLGIKPYSVAEKVLDTMEDLGSESTEGAKFYTRGMEPGVSKLGTAPPLPPSVATPAVVLHDTTFNERLRRLVGKTLGYTLPKHVAADETVGNNLAKYGSARIAAPLVAQSLATDVLGKHYKDAAFDRVLGDVIVEDQLRGVRKGFEEAAAKAKTPEEKRELLDAAAKVTTLIGKPGHSLRNDVQFERLLRNPEIVEAIERHKKIIQPLAEKAHSELGGKLARGGENTDAFANLIAILSPDDVETTRDIIYGSKKGDITNPLKKSSMFSKQRKGTASDYERSYRKMAERMIRGNYEQAALRDYYNSLIAKKLAIEAKPGIAPPETPKGVRFQQRVVELRGAGPGQTRRVNLWMHPDLINEFDQATAKDGPVPKTLARHLMLAATDAQIVGLTDAWWHTVNMAAAIATSPGGKSLWVDALRRMPGVNVIDTGVRIAHQLVRLTANHPDVQRELAKIAEVGAGRGEPLTHGPITEGITKGLGKLGIPEEVKGVPTNPLKWTSTYIKAVDKAGRLALNGMFDNLVKQGLVKDGAKDRREFINHMGQYNTRLMGYYESKAREIGLSSFVVAGRNFNRLAMQKLLMSPGVDAASRQAWIKLHAVEALTWASAMIALPVMANLALTGKWHGRPGVPFGAVDTGKDDPQGRPIYIDPLQTMLLRRGLRITGLQSLFRGTDEKLGSKQTATEMAKDVFAGIVHPWAGPPVRTGKIALTGYDTSGYLVSKNPDDIFENLKAALKNANPMVSAYLRGHEQGTGGGRELTRSLTSATGIAKVGRFPTQTERFEQVTGKKPEQATLTERAKAQKQIEASKEPNTNDEAKREAARRSLFKGFARTDGLKEALAPENQKFLSDYKLHLTGFVDELQRSGAKVPLTREESEFFAAAVAKHYDERIAAFRKAHTEMELIEMARKGHLQKVLQSRLDLARARARQDLKKRMQVPREP